MLSIKKLNQYYGESHALWDIDLEVPAGQCTVLMGRNGVGKTTLLQCIMGLLPVFSGAMDFAGVDLRTTSAERRANLGIGYVPQGRQVFPMLTVEENLRIGLPARRDRVRQVPGFIYELFPVLKEMLGRRGGDLSGGQHNSSPSAGHWCWIPGYSSSMNPRRGFSPISSRRSVIFCAG